MTQKYTNEKDISLLMSVFLADDRYKHDDRPNTISVTTLMKSPRQIILGNRLTASESLTDISSLLASRLGTSIHESIEKAWKENYKSALEALGYPNGMINKIRINPTENVSDAINLYLEINSEKQVGDWIVTGTLDIILDGSLRDVKSTKTWTYTSGANEKKYILQMSLYRWLNPHKVLDDTGYIEFLFMDWSPLKAGYEEGYPPLPVLSQPLPLISLVQTEAYVVSKLALIEEIYMNAEAELPHCTDEDLWINESEWKYYSKPDAKRASKNFQQNKAAAYIHLNEKGKGEVREIKGKAKACNYCNARPICSQYSMLVAQDKI